MGSIKANKGLMGLAITFHNEHEVILFNPALHEVVKKGIAANTRIWVPLRMQQLPINSEQLAFKKQCDPGILDSSLRGQEKFMKRNVSLRMVEAVSWLLPGTERFLRHFLVFFARWAGSECASTTYAAVKSLVNSNFLFLGQPQIKHHGHCSRPVRRSKRIKALNRA